jgi:hypothetical protein
MRRTGRYVGVDKGVVSCPHKVNVEDRRDYDVYTKFIRDNCRRGNWSKVCYRKVDRVAFFDCVTYLFADEQDAMTFKLAFG